MVAGAAVSEGGDELYKSLSNNCHPRWYLDPGLRRLNIGIFLIISAATTNGFDSSLMNGLLAIPAFQENLVNRVSTEVLGLNVGAISLGGVLALIPASYLSDRYGRKICLAAGTFIMMVASITQALTSGPWAFLATKLIIGVGIAAVLVAGPALATETAHPRNRGVVTSFFEAAFYWGSIVSAIATLGGLYINNPWSWRMPVILQLFFPVLLVIGLIITPESPRYLIAAGKHSKALEILARFHANGVRDDELVMFEYNEICEAIQREKLFARHSTWKIFFSTPGNRQRLLICFLVGIMSQWAGNGIVSYYLTPILKSLGVTDPVQQNLINLGLQIWNAIFAACGALACEHFGRRPLWLTSAIGMLFSFSIVTALSATYAQEGNKAAGKAAIAMLFIFFAFYDLAFTPLSFSYPVEILPYRLRSRGFSVTLVAIFGAGFFNQYVNPIALAKLEWRFYFVYIGCLISFIAIIWFLFPETKGRSLEEIAEVFDGPAGRTNTHRRASVVAGARVIGQSKGETAESEEEMVEAS